jgi:hypothetical protein
MLAFQKWLQLRQQHARHVFEVLQARCDVLVRKPWLGRSYNFETASAGVRAFAGIIRTH